MNIFNIKAILLATACGISMAAAALPAVPTPMRHTLPDGSVVWLTLHGDEHNHWYTDPAGEVVELTEDGKVSPSRIPERHAPSPLRVASTTGFPAHGRQKALAVMVEFPSTASHPEGLRFTTPGAHHHFNALLNDPDFSADGATGSVRQYFLDSSQGQFDIEFDLFGPLTLKHDYTYYAQKTNGQDLNAWEIAVEALTQLDESVDFHDYDRDEDGIIDNVYIFYAGPGAATGGDYATSIWQHAGNVEGISHQTFLFDGLRLNHYACSNEYRHSATQGLRICEGIGTVVHEFSHVMGLPDLYDTYGTSYTPGPWSVMDTGCHLNESRTPPLYSAFERESLDWKQPQLLGSRPETVTLCPSLGMDAVRINTSNADEYFLLENRQTDGWDAYLPAHGLLVWHICYSKDNWTYNQVNTNPARPGVQIVEADGMPTANTRGGDTFPGTSGLTLLTDDGWPNMLTVDGKPTGCPISQIMEAGGVVTFQTMRHVSSLDKVEGLKTEALHPETATIAWSPSAHPDALYLLSLYTKDDNGTHRPVSAYRDLTVHKPRRRVDGLKPSTEYFVTVKAKVGDVVSPASDELSFITPEWSFAHTAPNKPHVSEIMHDGFALTWSPLEDAVDYRVGVYTRCDCSLAGEDCTFDLPLSQLGSLWTTDCTFTSAIQGYYGQNPPAISLSEHGNYFGSIDLDEELHHLSFWYRERNGSGDNSLSILALVGNEWEVLESLPLEKSQPERIAGVSFPENCTAFRIRYDRIGKGSLCIDDVALQWWGDTDYLPVFDGELPSTGGDTVYTHSGLSADSEYIVFVHGVDAQGVESMPSERLVVRTAQSSLHRPLPQMTVPQVGPDRKITVEGDSNLKIYAPQGLPVSNPVPCSGIYFVVHHEKTFKLIIR